MPIAANARRTAAERDSFFTGELRGYHREGRPVQGTLEHFAPLDYNLRRGRCYMLALRLETDADYSDVAQRGLRIWSGPPGAAASEQVDATGPGLYGPGALANLGCPQATGRVSVNMAPARRAMLPASSDPMLGTGVFYAELHSRAITPAALAREADRAFQARVASEMEREHRSREACRRCVREREQCRDRGYSPCLPAYDTCVHAHVEQPEMCP